MDEFNALIAPGSDGDFDALYRMTYLQLRRTLTAILGDSAAAEDCVQETFVRAYKAWPRWRKDAPVQAWLYRIAVNVASSYRRRQKLRSLKEAIWMSRAQPPEDPAALAVESEVRRALRRLPPKQAAVVVLHYYHGRTLVDIGRMLKISKRSVAFRLADAKSNLQRILGPEWDINLPSSGAPEVHGYEGGGETVSVADSIEK